MCVVFGFCSGFLFSFFVELAVGMFLVDSGG